MQTHVKNADRPAFEINNIVYFKLNQKTFRQIRPFINLLRTVVAVTVFGLLNRATAFVEMGGSP